MDKPLQRKAFLRRPENSIILLSFFDLAAAMPRQRCPWAPFPSPGFDFAGRVNAGHGPLFPRLRLPRKYRRSASFSSAPPGTRGRRKPYNQTVFPHPASTSSPWLVTKNLATARLSIGSANMPRQRCSRAPFPSPGFDFFVLRVVGNLLVMMPAQILST